MRLKKVKNAYEKLSNSKYVTDKPEFSNNNPIYMEIGMGKGKFIIENALKYPNINFIGVEKFDSVLVRATEKLEELELDNLKLMRIDALELDTIFNKEIDRIYLNFSDPWPKKRHHNRRLTSKIFLDKYSKMCRKEEIYLKTDNNELFDYSVESLTAYGYKIDYELYNEITTEYEDKFTSLGNPIFKLHAVNTNLHKK